MKKKSIPFKCPYNNFSCTEIDTASMIMYTSCEDCKHYGNGVIPSRGAPILESIINFLKKLFYNVPRQCSFIPSISSSIF